MNGFVEEHAEQVRRAAERIHGRVRRTPTLTTDLDANVPSPMPGSSEIVDDPRSAVITSMLPSPLKSLATIAHGALPVG